MKSNTFANVGIRRFIYGSINAYRNFENDGLTRYSALREPLEFLGVKYHSGDALPFDVAGTSYSKLALQKLQLAWDQEWIVPTV